MSREFIPTPYSLTTLIVEVLKGFFSQPGEFVYSSTNRTASTLDITEKNVFKPETIQSKPSIVTSRGPISISRYALGDVKTISPQGTTDYSKIYVGSYTLMCIAKNAIQCEKLATELLGCLLCFEHAISRDWDFIKFKGVDFGEVQSYQEHTDIFYIPVVFEFQVEKTWGITEVSPSVGKIREVLSSIDYGC